MDWAEKEANWLKDTGGNLFPDQIATALRKAKADGMREAADLAAKQSAEMFQHSKPSFGGTSTLAKHYSEALNSLSKELEMRASEIENPTP